MEMMIGSALMEKGGMMMADREKVIKGLEIHTGLLSSCKDGCPYFIGDGSKCKDLLKDALSMLKEQEEEIENLKQTAQSMMEGICLLKEQGKCENCAIAIEDRQPVVRCKYCTHTEHCEIYAGWDGKNPDWFCADGERRDDDG